MTATTPQRQQRTFDPPPAADPQIGRWLAAMADCRRRTLRAVEGLSPAALDRTPPSGGESIGTLLYHIAAIEVDYLAGDVLQGQLDPAIWAEFPHDVRDGAGHLSIVNGLALADHLARLERVRALLVAAYAVMSLDDFRRLRAVEDYDITPEYTLHHLMQHEAEHRAAITRLRAEAET